ncbi:MAG: hypothetical protein HFE77_06100 [Clostridiales bacterium]|nr:hypothetical protein [Clostridiales bacterium]
MFTENYVIRHRKITKKTKIAFLSDLHSEHPHGLERAVENHAPDLVIIGGDLFDRRAANEPALQLMDSLTENYACFYTPGNHELYIKERTELYATLRNLGMTILDGQSTPFTTDKGQRLWITGLTRREQSAKQSAPPDDLFHILIYHYPEKVLSWAGGTFDLILSGHEHGGIWRTKQINGLLGHSGLFPKHAGGLYQEKGTTLVVSRGLTSRIIGLPRFGNPPELVMVELLPEN